MEMMMKTGYFVLRKTAVRRKWDKISKKKKKRWKEESCNEESSNKESSNKESSEDEVIGVKLELNSKEDEVFIWASGPSRTLY